MKEYKTNLDRITLAREPSNYKRVKINRSSDINEYVRNFYHDDLTIYESVFILLLNNAHNTIGYAKISQGGITGAVVDIRIVCKYALESLAKSVVMIHNHPSGSLKPSQADKQMTKKIKDALNTLEITLLDHLIITEDSYFSFADELEL